MVKKTQAKKVAPTQRQTRQSASRTQPVVARGRTLNARPVLPHSGIVKTTQHLQRLPIYRKMVAQAALEGLDLKNEDFALAVLEAFDLDDFPQGFRPAFSAAVRARRAKNAALAKKGLTKKAKKAKDTTPAPQRVPLARASKKIQKPSCAPKTSGRALPLPQLSAQTQEIVKSVLRQRRPKEEEKKEEEKERGLSPATKKLFGEVLTEEDLKALNAGRLPPTPFASKLRNKLRAAGKVIKPRALYPKDAIRGPNFGKSWLYNIFGLATTLDKQDSVFLSGKRRDEDADSTISDVCAGAQYMHKHLVNAVNKHLANKKVPSRSPLQPTYQQLQEKVRLLELQISTLNDTLGETRRALTYQEDESYNKLQDALLHQKVSFLLSSLLQNSINDMAEVMQEVEYLRERDNDPQSDSDAPVLSSESAEAETEDLFDMNEEEKMNLEAFGQNPLVRDWIVGAQEDRARAQAQQQGSPIQERPRFFPSAQQRAQIQAQALVSQPPQPQPPQEQSSLMEVEQPPQQQQPRQAPVLVLNPPPRQREVPEEGKQVREEYARTLVASFFASPIDLANHAELVAIYVKYKAFSLRMAVLEQQIQLMREDPHTQHHQKAISRAQKVLECMRRAQKALEDQALAYFLAVPFNREE